MSSHDAARQLALTAASRSQFAQQRADGGAAPAASSPRTAIGAAMHVQTRLDAAQARRRLSMAVDRHAYRMSPFIRHAERLRPCPGIKLAHPSPESRCTASWLRDTVTCAQTLCSRSVSPRIQAAIRSLRDPCTASTSVSGSSSRPEQSRRDDDQVKPICKVRPSHNAHSTKTG